MCLLALLLLSSPAFSQDSSGIAMKISSAEVFAKEFESGGFEDEKLFKKAEKLYLQVIKLDPDNYIAHYNLAVMYYNYSVHLNNKKGLTPRETKKNQDKAMFYNEKSKKLFKRVGKLKP